jgi:hypothetical protein
MRDTRYEMRVARSEESVGNGGEAVNPAHPASRIAYQDFR